MIVPCISMWISVILFCTRRTIRIGRYRQTGSIGGISDLEEEFGIRGFNSTESMNNFIVANPNTSMIAVSFKNPTEWNGTTVRFVLGNIVNSNTQHKHNTGMDITPFEYEIQLNETRILTNSGCSSVTIHIWIWEPRFRLRWIPRSYKVRWRKRERVENFSTYQWLLIWSSHFVLRHGGIWTGIFVWQWYSILWFNRCSWLRRRRKPSFDETNGNVGLCVLVELALVLYDHEYDHGSLAIDVRCNRPARFLHREQFSYTLPFLVIGTKFYLLCDVAFVFFKTTKSLQTLRCFLFSVIWHAVLSICSFTEKPMTTMRLRDEFS